MAEATDELNTDQIIRDVRLLFPNLFETAVIKGNDTGKYQVKLILEPKRHAEALAQVKNNIKALAMQKFGSADLSGVKNVCLRGLNFSGLEDEGDLYELMAKSKSRPPIVDKDGRTPIDEKDKDRFYNGVRAAVRIGLWAVNNDFGKTIGCNLNAVQFLGDDTPLSGGRMSFEDAVAGFDNEDEDDDYLN